MKSIANIIHHKNFPFEILDDQGNLIYYEKSGGWWSKRLYDSNGNKSYHETSNGYLEDYRK